ncbi:MAG TPA: Mpo1-like protein, partial [Archangium sp.]|uniref:Mpo1-like protein n=1 Tax=Archangium sp. TaxID=1872627 RepID=UPI002ED8EA12
MLKPQTQALFDEYISSHQHPTNRLTHKVAIPLIVLHIVAMLDWVRLVSVPLLPGGSLTLAFVAWAL